MADENAEPKKLPQRSYGRVVISLENCIFDKEKLKTTASQSDGLSLETEINLRILGCEYIQTAGILLRLPQVAMATGQVIFQRFYYSKSFVKHNMEIVAMACVNLASKIEEAPRRLRDVVNVFYHIKQKNMGKSLESMVLDAKYISLKNNVIKAERRILKELGFCVHVKHPHKMIVMYLQQLELRGNKRLVQTAWNYMNDSLRTDVFVRYSPETIACACIYLSARQLQVVLPENPDWYGLMGATREDMEYISLTILRLYTTRRKSYSVLDREVEQCRVSLQAAKMRAKGLLVDGVHSTGGTPQNFSPHSNSTQNSPVKVKAQASPGLPNSYKVGNNVTKEESNGTTATMKQENGAVPDAKESKTRSGSVSTVESSSRSRSRSNERDRTTSRSSKQKDKRRSRGEGQHRSRSHKRRKYGSRSPSRSRSRSPSHDRHHSGSRKIRHRKSPHREHSRGSKQYVSRDRSRSRSRSNERSSDKYRKSSKRRSSGRGRKERR